jgi:hypothetical protein
MMATVSSISCAVGREESARIQMEEEDLRRKTNKSASPYLSIHRNLQK